MLHLTLRSVGPGPALRSPAGLTAGSATEPRNVDIPYPENTWQTPPTAGLQNVAGLKRADGNGARYDGGWIAAPLLLLLGGCAVIECTNLADQSIEKLREVIPPIAWTWVCFCDHG